MQKASKFRILISIRGFRLFSAPLLIHFFFCAQAQLVAFQEFLPHNQLLWDYEKIPLSWTGSGQVQIHLNEGINNLQEEKYELATSDLSNVISLDPGNWAAYYYRAMAHKNLMQFEEAEADLKKVCLLNKTLGEAWLERGKIHLLNQRYTEESACFQEASKVDRAYKTDVLFYLASMDLLKSNLSGAIKKLKSCTKQNPDHYPALVTYGWILYVTNNDAKQTLPYLEKVILKDSTNRYALHLRAMIMADRNPDQSIQDLTRLIQFNPTVTTYVYLRGLLFTETEQYEKAFNDFQKVLQQTAVDERYFRGQQSPLDKRIDMQYAGYYLLRTLYSLPESEITKVKKAYCLFLIHEFNEGLNTLKSIPSYNVHPLILFLIAIGLEHSGKHEDAWQFYLAALKRDNSIQDAHTKCGIYNSNVGNWWEAEKHFTEALKINDALQAVYKLRGVARYFLNRYDEAVADFTQYLRYDSLDDEALKNRAFAYRMSGKVREGIADLVKCKSCHASLADYDLFLNDLLEQSDTLSAIASIEKFHAQDSSLNAEILRIDLLCRVNRMNPEEAIRTIHKLLNARNSLNEEQRVRLLTTLGAVYMHNNQLEDAENTLTEAVKKSNYAPAFRLRGILYLRQQQTEKAYHDLKKAVILGDQEARKLLEKR
jgi:tetratricopeptide (TPR) repeat protein